MKKQDFSCSISTGNTTKETFDAITRVSDWWAKNVEGDSQNLDSVFTVRFRETSSVIKIVDYSTQRSTRFHGKGLQDSMGKDYKRSFSKPQDFYPKDKIGAYGFLSAFSLLKSVFF
jgi:hypothetical protein